MQVLWAFKMKKVKVPTKELESIAILKDALLAIKTLTLEVLYIKSIAEHMRWHYEHRYEDGAICHPSDGTGWKHFDDKYPDFAAEP